MTRYFVNRKSELTALMVEFMNGGHEAYRTRLNCGCPSPQNRRNGVIVVDPFTQIVMAQLIRCRGCVQRKEGGRV